MRNETFKNQPISVFLTTRQYWGLEGTPLSLTDSLTTLFDVAEELATDKVVPNFVNPLASAIASRS